MPDAAVSLGTIYATIALNLQQLQEDAQKAMSTLEEVRVQAGEALSGTPGGSASGALTGVQEQAQSAASAIAEVGVAGASAGEEVATALGAPVESALAGVHAQAQAATVAVEGVGAAGVTAGEEAAAGAEKAAAGFHGAGAAAEEGAGGVQGFLGHVLGIGAAIGGVELAVTGFEMVRDKVTEAMHAGMEANQVMAQTVAGLKSTNDASGMTAQGIDDLSTHIMRMTGIDDDAVHSAANMLLTFTSISKDVFPQATQAVADLATKMNGGAIPSAMQMQQASIQLGKALGAPLKGYTALQRVGVTFSEQQKEQIKQFMATGNVAGAQNVILKEMNKEFGGAAAAAGQANGGIAILRAEMENTTQTIGQALTPVIESLTSALMPLAQWAGETIPAALKFLTQHGDEVKLILAALGIAIATVVVPALAGFAVAAWAAASPIIAAAVPVLALGAALAGLALMFKHLYDTSAPLRHALDGLKAVVTEIGAIFKFQFGQTLQTILPYVKEVASWVGGELTQAFQAIAPVVTSAVQWLTNLLWTFSLQIGPAFQQVDDAIQRFAGWIQSTVIPAVKLAAQWLGDHLAPIIKQVADWTENTLVPALKKFGDWLTDTALPAIQQFADWLGSKAGQALRQVADWVQGTLLPALRRFGDWMQNTALPAIKQFADWLGSKAGQALRQVADWVQGTLLPALKKFGDWLTTTALPAIQQFAGWLQGQMGQALKQTADWVQGTLLPALQKFGTWLVTTAIPAIQSFALWLKDHLGASLQQTAQWVTTTLLPALQRFGDWVMKTAIPAIQQFAGWLHDHLGPGFTNLQTTVTTVWNVLQPIWQALQAQVQPILDSLSTTLNTSLIPAWDSLKGSFDQIKPAVSDLITLISEQLGPVWTQLQPILQVIGAIIGVVLITAIGLLVGALTGLIDWLGQVIQGAIKFAGGLIEAISGALEIVTSIVTVFFKILFDVFHGNWSKIGDDLKQMWSGISDGLTKVVGGIWLAIQGLFQVGITATLALLKGFVNGFAEAVDAIAHALGVKGNPIPMWDPGGSGDTGAGAGMNAPTTTSGHGHAYARGTKHHPGGLALVGEEGPEVVDLPAGSSVLPHKQSMALLAALGLVSGLPGYAGGVGDVLGGIGQRVSDALGGLAGIIGQPVQAVLSKALSAAGVNAGALTNVLGNIGGGALGTLSGWALPYLTQLMQSVSASSFNAPGGSVPGNVTEWLQQAIALTSVPLNWLSPLSVIAMHESGGDPHAVNNYDINARHGDPSRGLMQTIMSTFLGNALPGHRDIWNPVDNAAAAIEYILHRYGSVFNVPGILSIAHGGPYVGYANGGILRETVAGIGLSSGTRYLMGENGPEAVTPLGKMGGGDIYHITVEVVAAPDDGEPYAAGVAFGNGFASGFQQARTQRGL